MLRQADDWPSRRITTRQGRYLEVPVAMRPPSIDEHAWDMLSTINDYIIDHVSYDQERANDPDSGLVQAPHETIARGRGVCRDYAALFEHLARAQGFEVGSVRSDQMDHSWNVVRLGGKWWIVDVTWNDGEIFAGGQSVPAHVMADPDYRKRYFLTTPERERDLRRCGLVSSTHLTPDAEPIDYERTLEASAVVDKIDPLIDRRQRAIDEIGATVNQHNQLVARYNFIVEQVNSEPNGEARKALQTQLSAIRAEVDLCSARITAMRQDRGALDARIDVLYGDYLAIERVHPIGIEYRLTRATGAT